MNIFNTIRNSFIYKLLALQVHRVLVLISPRIEMQRCYKSVFNMKADLKNPKDLIEKIYWLQLYSDTSLWTLCADKYRVREYLQRKGLDGFLPRLLGKWDNPDDFSFDNLPAEFILKMNNGCEACKIIRDKSSENIDEIKRYFKQMMLLPFGYSGAQLHYVKIKPCIIAEELLHENEDMKLISPNSVVDYKIWCINHEPECVFVGYDRKPGKLSMALYDLTWTPMPDKLVNTQNDHFQPNVAIPKPACLDEMINIAKRISADFHEVRVDFYVINDKPLIGELTFTSGYGYFTRDYYKYLGSKITVI